jgi:hypothetical protein
MLEVQQRKGMGSDESLFAFYDLSEVLFDFQDAHSTAIVVFDTQQDVAIYHEAEAYWTQRGIWHQGTDITVPGYGEPVPDYDEPEIEFPFIAQAFMTHTESDDEAEERAIDELDALCSPPQFYTAAETYGPHHVFAGPAPTTLTPIISTPAAEEEEELDTQQAIAGSISPSLQSDEEPIGEVQQVDDREPSHGADIAEPVLQYVDMSIRDPRNFSPVMARRTPSPVSTRRTRGRKRQEEMESQLLNIDALLDQQRTLDAESRAALLTTVNRLSKSPYTHPNALDGTCLQRTTSDDSLASMPSRHTDGYYTMQDGKPSNVRVRHTFKVNCSSEVPKTSAETAQRVLGRLKHYMGKFRQLSTPGTTTDHIQRLANEKQQRRRGETVIQAISLIQKVKASANLTIETREWCTNRSRQMSDAALDTTAQLRTMLQRKEGIKPNPPRVMDSAHGFEYRNNAANTAWVRMALLDNIQIRADARDRAQGSTAGQGSSTTHTMEEEAVMLPCIRTQTNLLLGKSRPPLPWHELPRPQSNIMSTPLR